ncbi:unnamed protein product [Protopolystoma xenopodis]|uniref:Uncharacterized protein n=1 Tax=Protopolystoma xenopodis TaxID=117903 RepID=A0A448WQB6_9PLAT|nr:unnamed protein product [Protopolystoma xenopodis]
MQHRNLELVALLERKHEAHTRAVAQLTSARDQAVKKITSAEASRSLQEIAMKRELAKAREQVSAFYLHDACQKGFYCWVVKFFSSDTVLIKMIKET